MVLGETLIRLRSTGDERVEQQAPDRIAQEDQDPAQGGYPPPAAFRKALRHIVLRPGPARVPNLDNRSEEKIMQRLAMPGRGHERKEKNPSRPLIQNRPNARRNPGFPPVWRSTTRMLA